MFSTVIILILILLIDIVVVSDDALFQCHHQRFIWMSSFIQLLQVSVRLSVTGCFVGNDSRGPMNYSATYGRTRVRSVSCVPRAASVSCAVIILVNTWKLITMTTRKTEAEVTQKIARILTRHPQWKTVNGRLQSENIKLNIHLPTYLSHTINIEK